ncbi:hypothetical protein PGB90_009005 [Kerria lacca]
MARAALANSTVPRMIAKLGKRCAKLFNPLTRYTSKYCVISLKLGKVKFAKSFSTVLSSRTICTEPSIKVQLINLSNWET